MYGLDCYFSVLFIALGSLGPFDEPPSEKTIIRLGGPRKASVEILKDDNFYYMTATFISVKSFDRGLNISISRDKGDFYIREALYKYLKVKNGNFFQISQLKKIKADYTDKLFTYVVQIPVDCIKTKKNNKEKNEQNGEDKKPEHIINSNALLNAKNDQQATFDYILKINEADFPEFKNDLNDFYKKVAESEIKIIDRFEGFVTGLKTENFLLFVERDELNQKAKSEMAKTIDRLKILVKNAELEAVKKSD